MTVNFKKTLVSGLMAASLAAVSAGAMATSVPVDVPVTFTGAITDNTCDTPSVENNGVVAFGNILQTAFGTSGIGAVGAEKAFTINFANCGTEADDVEVWFIGATTNTIHALDNPAVAGNSANVGVQVYGGADAGTLLKSDDVMAKATYTGALTAGGTGSVNLVAKVVQTTATLPTLGDLNASGTLVVNYP
jgi:major type 1 subunit fimbrin (pilin)